MPFPQIFLGDAVPPNGIRTRGNSDTVAFHQIGLQRNTKLKVIRKIRKIVVTRCHVLKRKCTKFDFDWGSAPDPAGGAHSTPTYPLAGFKGLLLRGGRTRGKEKGGEKAGEGWLGKDFGAFPQFQICRYTTHCFVSYSEMTYKYSKVDRLPLFLVCDQSSLVDLS